MKRTNPRVLVLSCVGWAMVAAAPLAGAQTPPPASGAPATATPPAATAPVAAPPAAEPPAPPSADQISYIFGLTFGEEMHRAGISDQVIIDAIARGLQDGLHGKKTTPADHLQLQTYVRSVQQALLARNQAAAKEFLERNAHAKGVTTTASGLEYKIVAPGDRKAASATAADQVTVQYRGTLLDDSEFDSSYAHGAPATFAVNGVIKGWQEALVLMKPGAKWQLFVPPELAYGAGPRPGIPGGSLLIFDVELLSVKSNAVPTPPKPAASHAPTTKPTPAGATPPSKSLGGT